MTRQRIGRALLVLVSVALPSALPAAARAASEIEIWLAAELAAELLDDFELGISHDARWDQDVGRLHELMPGVALTYRGVDHLRLGVGYRFEAVQSNARGWEIGHRLHFDGRSALDAGPLELSYRLRLQATKDSDPDVTFWAPKMRHRARIAYDDLGLLTPYLDTEIFVGLGQPSGVGLEKWRFRIGMSYDFGDHEVGVSYMAQRRVGDPTAVRHDVLGLTYELSL